MKPINYGKIIEKAEARRAIDQMRSLVSELETENELQARSQHGKTHTEIPA